MDFVQHILNGLLQGCILALVGLGFSLVWGILNIVNLAHAAFIMLAAYLTYFLWSLVGIDPFATLPITMGVLFAGGYLLQRYVINRVMGASVLATFLLTFGLESLLVNLALRLFSADTRQSKPLYANASLTIGPFYLPYTQLGAVLVALLLTYLVYVFLDHTRTGSSIRAVGQDRVAARLMGIDIGRTYALTFGLGAALAAASGTLLSTTSGFAANAFSSFNVLAFSVVVLGGLGSIPGALLGGLVFGLVYELAGTYVLSQRDLVIFVILILVLVWRPTGLLGREGYR
ncbi:MAG: branched-chain amino acid ABC transporter permease [Chloroflexota bacterium]|nr:branched-chain amino acid ABC transporter permease [Chloroflexota bacterium]